MPDHKKAHRKQSGDAAERFEFFGGF